MKKTEAYGQGVQSGMKVTSLKMGMMATASWVACVMAVSVSFAYGAVKTTHIAPKPEKYALPSSGDLELSAELISTTLKNARDHFSKRKPASSSVDEKDLAEDFKAFRTKFLAVKTADELDALLVEAEKNYDSYSPDLKYFVAQVELIRPYRAIVHRMRPLFEHTKSVHSVAVTTLKSMASNLRVYLPTDQWEAGFAYVTVPSSDPALNTQFQSIREFQDFLVTTIPNLYRAMTRLNALYKGGLQKPLVWDNKLFYGTGTFEDGLDRYRTHDFPELLTTMTSLRLTAHSILVFCAYNQNEFLDFFEDMGRLAGLNGFNFLTELGVSAQERAKVWKKRKYQSFLTLSENDVGKQLMKEAFIHLKAAVFYTNTAWKHLDGKADSDYSVLSFGRFQMDRRAIELRLKNMMDMVNGPTSIRSPITGEVVDVNLPAFFSNPPSNLKQLLPTQFDKSPEFLSVKSTSGERVEYRNYFRGRAIGWDNGAWAPYFPSAAGQSSDYMMKAVRVLRQSWGGDYLSPVLNAVLL
jgi:hypothetical protein